MITPPSKSRRSKGAKAAQSAGKRFQDLIALSARNSGIELFELPSCGGRFVGRGRMINEQMPCDFIGTVRIMNLPIFFDAKSCGVKQASFPLNNPKQVEPHQIRFLMAQGRAGAIAGLLVKSERTREYLWLSWRDLDVAGCIQWHSHLWMVLGEVDKPVSFSRLLALAAMKKEVSQ